jgi:hypothetical protein
MLKLILKSAEEFEKVWVHNVRENGDKEVFQEGSLVHSLILEPHLVATEYAFFPGLRRAGKEFERFKQNHPGKRLMTDVQRVRSENYTQAFKQNEEAVKLISAGASEFTLEGEIAGVLCKARFDYINNEQSYLVDIKTSGYPTGKEIFKDTIASFRYDLSAALYLMLAEKAYGKRFDWYFIVISKPDKHCSVYKLSEATRRAGEAFVYQALEKYKRCKESNNWLDNNAPKWDTQSEVEEV